MEESPKALFIATRSCFVQLGPYTKLSEAILLFLHSFFFFVVLIIFSKICTPGTGGVVVIIARPLKWGPVKQRPLDRGAVVGRMRVHGGAVICSQEAVPRWMLTNLIAARLCVFFFFFFFTDLRRGHFQV
jgi:hypothetical protein